MQHITSGFKRIRGRNEAEWIEKPEIGQTECVAVGEACKATFRQTHKFVYTALSQSYINLRWLQPHSYSHVCVYWCLTLQHNSGFTGISQIYTSLCLLVSHIPTCLGLLIYDRHAQVCVYWCLTLQHKSGFTDISQTYTSLCLLVSRTPKQVCIYWSLTHTQPCVYRCLIVRHKSVGNTVS